MVAITPYPALQHLWHVNVAPVRRYKFQRVNTASRSSMDSPEVNPFKCKLQAYPYWKWVGISQSAVGFHIDIHLYLGFLLDFFRLV